MENIKVNAQQPPSKNFQVLLILIQHGANGLNLLVAQHVVLGEPLLNLATEAQAISQVHRIGQENKTLVHRFIYLFIFYLNFVVKVRNFILFRIYGCVVQRSLNKNIYFVLYCKNYHH